jgi:hypothetical protein
MKERPILFSTEMVNAILEGRKTMTRRFVKPQLDENLHLNRDYIAEYDEGVLVKCPYGQPGDRLWVRESFCLSQPKDPETYYFRYKCGIHPYSENPASEKYDFSSPDKWKPSIHMPREASRILLEVVSVRVERLKDITEEDALNEGVESYFSEMFQDTRFKCYSIKDNYWRCAKSSFKSLWVKINGNGSWKINPWVWVVEFRRL